LSAKLSPKLRGKRAGEGRKDEEEEENKEERGSFSPKNRQRNYLLSLNNYLRRGRIYKREERRKRT